MAGGIKGDSRLGFSLDRCSGALQNRREQTEIYEEDRRRHSRLRHHRAWYCLAEASRPGACPQQRRSLRPGPASRHAPAASITSCAAVLERRRDRHHGNSAASRQRELRRPGQSSREISEFGAAASASGRRHHSPQPAEWAGVCRVREVPAVPARRYHLAPEHADGRRMHTLRDGCPMETCARVSVRMRHTRRDKRSYRRLRNEAG